MPAAIRLSILALIDFLKGFSNIIIVSFYYSFLKSSKSLCFL